MTSPPAPDHDEGLLLAFLKGRDVHCPSCDYNLRDLSRPQCPECHEALALTVGLKRARFGWFLIAVTPGFFSGIAAVILLAPLAGSLLLGQGTAPWVIWVTDAFGWVSVLAALVLVKYRFVFLRQPPARQRLWAAIAWAIHLAAFAVMLILFLLFG